MEIFKNIIAPEINRRYETLFHEACASIAKLRFAFVLVLCKKKKKLITMMIREMNENEITNFKKVCYLDRSLSTSERECARS